MSIAITQLNLNGFYPRLPQFQVLINKYQPELICLQKTNFKPQQIIQLKNYTTYTKSQNTLMPDPFSVNNFK